MAVARGIWKYCPRCKQHLAPEEFGKDKWKLDGLHGHCRKCRRGYRLLRKPIPEIIWRVATDFPARISVPMEKWDLFDALVGAGVPVTIVKASGDSVDWGSLR